MWFPQQVPNINHASAPSTAHRRPCADVRRCVFYMDRCMLPRNVHVCTYTYRRILRLASTHKMCSCYSGGLVILAATEMPITLHTKPKPKPNSNPNRILNYTILTGIHQTAFVPIWLFACKCPSHPPVPYLSIPRRQAQSSSI